MASVCDVCGKGPGFGHNVSHSHRRTNRRWNPNIQTVRTPAGDGWRARYRMDGGFASDEVELDHGGRAWTLVLSRGPDDAAVAGVLDRALETWRWEA